MTDLLVFLLGMCWGAFVTGVVLVLRAGWKRGKEPWDARIEYWGHPPNKRLVYYELKDHPPWDEP